MSPHRYVACLVSVFALAFVGITSGLFFIEPFQGDLTRVGAFREAEYRWIEPQRYFTEPRTLSADSLDEYREPCDLLVVGDSFLMVDATIKSDVDTEGQESHGVLRSGCLSLKVSCPP